MNESAQQCTFHEVIFSFHTHTEIFLSLLIGSCQKQKAITQAAHTYTRRVNFVNKLYRAVASMRQTEALASVIFFVFF